MHSSAPGQSSKDEEVFKGSWAKALHLHQTYHTYARTVAEETGSFVEKQEALDHENAATTRVYVQHITVRADNHRTRIE